ncbi:hypothetical protein GCM10009843_32150 [Nocardioides bigeumensis]|uniref:Uncharacterized protein n=1 Tax=Nocardioides bigeumensis TaxID=433657 RepID=A0ABP5KFK0_9ACTN
MKWPRSVVKPTASIGEASMKRGGLSGVADARSPWTSYVTVSVPSPTVLVVLLVLMVVIVPSRSRVVLL